MREIYHNIGHQASKRVKIAHKENKKLWMTLFSAGLSDFIAF
jgi:hypothetical protein